MSHKIDNQAAFYRRIKIIIHYMNELTLKVKTYMYNKKFI